MLTLFVKEYKTHHFERPPYNTFTKGYHGHRSNFGFRVSIGGDVSDKSRIKDPFLDSPKGTHFMLSLLHTLAWVIKMSVLGSLRHNSSKA